MISSLQPSRPKVASSSHRQPLDQQQRRTAAAAPRTQIEAMPPHQTPLSRATVPATFNPALTHPVFFTNSWRKPPFVVAPMTSFSPVATGYVFSDGKRRDNLTKL